MSYVNDVLSMYLMPGVCKYESSVIEDVGGYRVEQRK